MKLKWFAIIITALLLGSILTSGAAYAVPDKEPIDKIVFVHYPKHAADASAKAANQGSTGGGVLAPNYKYSGIHWSNPSAIQYYINPTGSGVDGVTTIAGIRAAFDTWDNADGPLGYVYQSPTDSNGGVLDGTNVVSWADISAQYPNAIAVTTVWYYRYSRSIVEVDTQMNNGIGFNWSYTAPNVSHNLSGPAISDATRYSDPTNSGTTNTYDIRNIMTHEAGHWIMLGDLYNSRDSELTMYGYGATGELKKDTLGYGDELGVERVYSY